MARRLLALTFALALLAPGAADAQYARSSFHRQPDSIPGRPGPGSRFAGRVLSGYAGVAAGGFALGALAATLDSKYGSCNCDDPGLAGFILGFSAGALLGGSLVAAGPKWNGPCLFGERIGRALMGSAIATLPGAAATAFTGNDAMLILTPIFATPFASAVSLRSC